MIAHVLQNINDLPRPVALVLSGGASLGAVQVGQLRALADAHFVPDLIVGTSVGAINGLYVARHGLGPASVDALATVWRGLRGDEVFGKLGASAVFRLLRGASTLASSGGLEALVARELPRDASELVIPCHVVAVDYLSGRPVVLSGGDLRRNALASAAIPNVFPPVEVDGSALVDGGLAANVPIGPAARLGARSLVVLDAGYPCALPSPPRGLIPGLLHTLTLTLRNQVHVALPRIAETCVVAYLPAPCPLSVAPHDFTRTDELIGAGNALARQFLSGFAIAQTGVFGHPHFHG